MGTQFRHFHSGQAGAPQLTSGDTSSAPIFDILRACLVTGYGSVAPAGWVDVVPATSTAAAIRPNLPGAPVYLLQKNANTLLVTQCANVTGSLNPEGVQITRNWASLSSYSSHAGGLWSVFANDRTCYFVRYTPTGVANYVTVLGKFRSFSPAQSIWGVNGIASTSSTATAVVHFLYGFISSVNTSSSSTSPTHLLCYYNGAVLYTACMPEEGFWRPSTGLTSSFGQDFLTFGSTVPPVPWRSSQRAFFLPPDNIGRLAPVLMWDVTSATYTVAPFGMVPGVYAVAYRGGLTIGDRIEGTGPFSGKQWAYLFTGTAQYGGASTYPVAVGFAIELSDTIGDY